MAHLIIKSFPGEDEQLLALEADLFEHLPPALKAALVGLPSMGGRLSCECLRLFSADQFKEPLKDPQPNLIVIVETGQIPPQTQLPPATRELLCSVIEKAVRPIVEQRDDFRLLIMSKAEMPTTSELFVLQAPVAV